ncbi:chromosomal replication initiator protein DnaA [Malonomonas rubra]|uniref:chromosomal replication initiator protein DnaA n=1 Tax=Malonomonas rubra TaxID=57040 RepID=UPI0026E9CE85|nr:chromosomal replication initiator protein DnaA [Malonomonas rubra]
MTPERIWPETLAKLEESLNPQHFSMWIKPIECVNADSDLIKLQVPNKFVLNWIEEHFFNQIQENIWNIGGEHYRVQLALATPQSNKSKKNKKEDTSAPTSETVVSVPQHRTQTINLNSKYTFNEFVTGSSNQFAFAAAMAVANKPATTYNPLFIYGGVGLGKTHLINAVGNEILRSNPQTSVCYYTSEKFMNELINSLRYNKMDEFRNKFRSMDVLLIDDIQFIAGKERTQEEFFHTFNSLYESQKQIVLTSDKFPKEIPGLEERLRSRFEWGLVADIQTPDIETKQAILNMKAEQNGIDLPKDVALFLANSVSSNVRELEGYLIRIGAFASLTSTPVSLDMAKNILKDILVEKDRQISVEQVQKVVASHFGLKMSDLKSAKRYKALVQARQIAMYLTRQLTALSYPDIGDQFGGKDHSTIIHAIRKIEKLLSEDPQLEAVVNGLKKTINGN